jgi:hypothetical protein
MRDEGGRMKRKEKVGLEEPKAESGKPGDRWTPNRAG